MGKHAGVLSRQALARAKCAASRCLLHPDDQPQLSRVHFHFEPIAEITTDVFSQGGVERVPPISQRFRSALQNDDASSRDIFLSALRAILIFTLISIFN